jgi:tetratricopeptide (TPR) repeat protein
VIVLIALAAQLSIVAHAPDAAAACEAIEVSVAIRAPGVVAPQIVAPSLAPFEILRSSSVPRVTIDGSGGSLIAEYRYVLSTDRVGSYVIPPFEARLGGALVRSRPIGISIGPTTPRGNRPMVVARARVDTSLEVNSRAITQPETVFVGQQANYEVAVFLNETVRDRLRHNPTFFPPDMQSMLAYDLPIRGDPARRRVGTHCFDALLYQRALFPLLPGRFSIPPAQLVYSLPLSASFFSREESHELQTDSTVVVAIEPPLAARPADYAGAVGNLRVSARVDTSSSRVGDPVVLTVRVSGTGNVKLFPRPDVNIAWGSLVKGDERVRVDTTARKIGGSKEFDWVLTPRIAGELDLPPIRYPYFNPDSRRYEVASTSPARLRVQTGALASADTSTSDAILALRTSYRGAPADPMREHPALWVFLALAPLPALTLSVRDRRRGRVTPSRGAADRLRSMAQARAPLADAREVRRTFTAALRERLDIDPESFSAPGRLARALRRRGVSTTAAVEAEQLLRELDEAAFSAGGALPRDAAARALRLYATTDSEALSRADFGRAGTLVIGILLFGAAALHALDVGAAREAFVRGVSAYAAHDYVAARDAFIQSVAAEPRAPDAWANLGTAAWAAGDTARGVLGWQRALRAEPRASDMRERIELVHALPFGSAGYVPPVGAGWVFVVAALLWCIAWASTARRTYKGLGPRPRRVTALVAVALTIGMGGVVLSEHLAGRNLAVVRSTTSLSADPTLAGERGPTTIVGEVVRVGGRQGAWTRVVLDDGRDGWLESASLFPLGARDAPPIVH